MSPQKQFKHSLNDQMYANEYKLNFFTRSKFVKLNQTSFTSIQNLKLLSLAFVSLFSVKNLANPINNEIIDKNNSLVKKKLFKFISSIYKETKSAESAIAGSSNFNNYYLLTFLASIKLTNHEQLTWNEYDFFLHIFDLLFQAKLGPVNLLKDPKLAFLLMKAFKAYINRMQCLTCAEPIILLNNSEEVTQDFNENLESCSKTYMGIVDTIYSDTSYLQSQSDSQGQSQYLYNSVDCQRLIIDLISKCVELLRLQILCVNFKMNQYKEKKSLSSSNEEMTNFKMVKKDLVKRKMSYANKILNLIQANDSFRIKLYAANKFVKCAFKRDLFKKSLHRFFAQNSSISKSIILINKLKN